MKPISVDVLDAVPNPLYLDVSVGLRNLWRVRLALVLVSIAGRLMRTKIIVDECAEEGIQSDEAV